MAISDHRRWRLGSDFGFFDRSGERNDRVHFGELEEFHHPAVYSGDDHSGSTVLAVDVIVDDGAHAGRVHIRDAGEVEDSRAWGLAAANLGLEFEKIVQGKRAAEADDSCAGSFAFPIFDGKGIVDGHGEIKCKQ